MPRHYGLKPTTIEVLPYNVIMIPQEAVNSQMAMLPQQIRNEVMKKQKTSKSQSLQKLRRNSISMP
jgi:hypothetical protein